MFLWARLEYAQSINVLVDLTSPKASARQHPARNKNGIVKENEMCGGFKASRQFIVGKEEAEARKYQRLAELRSGRDYTWPLKSGDIAAIFGGHARKENLDSTWAGKIERHVKIMAETFAERDTVSGTKKFKNFNVPAGKSIHGIIVKNSHEVRIVTQPSYGNIAKVHHRCPDFVDIED